MGFSLLRAQRRGAPGEFRELGEFAGMRNGKEKGATTRIHLGKSARMGIITCFTGSKTSFLIDAFLAHSAAAATAAAGIWLGLLYTRINPRLFIIIGSFLVLSTRGLFNFVSSYMPLLPFLSLHPVHLIFNHTACKNQPTFSSHTSPSHQEPLNHSPPT